MMMYDNNDGDDDDDQWLKCHWTQGNAVPAPPVIEIQRSHTSNFIKRVPNHLLGAHFGPNNNNNNNNKHDNVYGAVIMAEPLREFTRFI